MGEYGECDETPLECVEPEMAAMRRAEMVWEEMEWRKLEREEAEREELERG